jgi:hypothetical protein
VCRDRRGAYRPSTSTPDPVDRTGPAPVSPTTRYRPLTTACLPGRKGDKPGPARSTSLRACPEHRRTGQALRPELRRLALCGSQRGDLLARHRKTERETWVENQTTPARGVRTPAARPLSSPCVSCGVILPVAWNSRERTRDRRFDRLRACPEPCKGTGVTTVCSWTAPELPNFRLHRKPSAVHNHENAYNRRSTKGRRCLRPVGDCGGQQDERI